MNSPPLIQRVPPYTKAGSVLNSGTPDSTPGGLAPSKWCSEVALTDESIGMLLLGSTQYRLISQCSPPARHWLSNEARFSGIAVPLVAGLPVPPYNVHKCTNEVGTFKSLRPDFSKFFSFQGRPAYRRAGRKSPRAPAEFASVLATSSLPQSTSTPDGSPRSGGLLFLA